MTRTDDEGFGARLTEATPVLRRRAMSLTHNAAGASDLVQETLLKAWIARARFEPGTQFLAWLMCIMRNTFLSELRRGARELASGLGDYAEGRIMPPSQDWAIAAEDVRAALADLPPDQAEAIAYVGALGGSYEDAASRFGCVVGTIKSRVCRGRQVLRRRCRADELFA